MKRLGIRKETKNIWEKRVPLNPKDAKVLIKRGYEIFVQPSEIRIYKDNEYATVGARIEDDLSKCDLIIGVKEIPINEVIPGIPHLFFSHTIKGQDYNMPLLQKILDSNITLFDYEKILDPKTKNRLVFFGEYAGNAGMVDTLWGLGKRLQLQYGISTPFSKIKRAYEYESVKDACEEIKKVGLEIEKNGLPEEICPFNIFLLGYGHVSKGCQKILDSLPIENIEPDKIYETQKSFSKNKIYLSTFKEKHLVERKDENPFELKDYFENGAKYKSKFENYISQASVIMNAIYWAPDCPVFVKSSELKRLQNADQKLIIIGDITCDINGSVQATVKSTTPDNPIYIYNAKTTKITDGFIGEGFADCAVDNLPCEFSREASDYFSGNLMPFIEKMLLNDYTKEIEESDLPEEMKSACIAHKGKLQRDFSYLEKFL